MSDGQRERLLQAIRASSHPMDDDELSQQTGIKPRQGVNQILRGLEGDGVVKRWIGPGGKLVTELTEAEHLGTPTPPGSDEHVEAHAEVAVVEPMPGAKPAPGSSHEQRDAERLMLDLLSADLGVRLNPARITLQSGSRVEIDGADESHTVLVECWAHQGKPKAAQRNKVLTDALKLSWIAQTLYPRPRLILCLSDPLAAAPFQPPSKSWATQALRDLGIEVMVVDLPADVRQGIQEAQRRQYR